MYLHASFQLRSRFSCPHPFLFYSYLFFVLFSLVIFFFRFWFSYLSSLSSFFSYFSSVLFFLSLSHSLSFILLIFISNSFIFTPCRRNLGDAACIFMLRHKNLQKWGVPNMTLNNIWLVKLWFLCSGKCRHHLYSHFSRVHVDSED